MSRLTGSASTAFRRSAFGVPLGMTRALLPKPTIRFSMDTRSLGARCGSHGPARSDERFRDGIALSVRPARLVEEELHLLEELHPVLLHHDEVRPLADL